MAHATSGFAARGSSTIIHVVAEGARGLPVELVVDLRAQQNHEGGEIEPGQEKYDRAERAIAWIDLWELAQIDREPGGADDPGTGRDEDTRASPARTFDFPL